MTVPVLIEEAKKAPVPVADLLARRYAAPEWCLEGEVTLGVRRVDYIAFNLWRHRIIGFEVKASRADWLRELADYEKAVPALEAVDEFFVVAPKGLLSAADLPTGSGWGLLEAKGERLYATVRPAVRERPATMSRALAARLIQRSGSVQFDRLRRAEGEVEQRVRHRLAEEKEARDETLKAERDDAVTRLDALYRALGTQPKSWEADRTALRVAHLLLEYERIQPVLRRNLEKLAELATGGLAALDETTLVRAVSAPEEETP